MKVVPEIDSLISTIFPPNHNRTPITNIPINSLKGPAKFFLFTTLLEYLKSKLFIWSNFFKKKDSDINDFITFWPLIVSSIIERKLLCCCCTSLESFLNFFPIIDIINPEIGINNITNSVREGLMVNITISVNKIVNGSLTINSNIDKYDVWISSISAVILDIKSPFFLLRKYEIGISKTFE